MKSRREELANKALPLQSLSLRLRRRFGLSQMNAGALDAYLMLTLAAFVGASIAVADFLALHFSSGIPKHPVAPLIA
jgi:hypothetical protein